MENQPPSDGYKLFRSYLWKAWHKVSASRPASFYLLFALFIIMVLGLQIVHVRNNPKEFALYLILMFAFLFTVLVRAVFDAAEILKTYLKESTQLFGNTLGEKKFVEELGRRVEEHRDDQ